MAFILITTLLNILGIKVADKANYLLMAFQLRLIVFFVVLSIGNVVTTSGAGGLTTTQPFFNDTSSFATISACAAIVASSFLGFDAVTTLTDETIEPRKTVPRAIMLIALIAGGIFVAVSHKDGGEQQIPDGCHDQQRDRRKGHRGDPAGHPVQVDAEGNGRLQRRRLQHFDVI